MINEEDISIKIIMIKIMVIKSLTFHRSDYKFTSGVSNKPSIS